MQRYSTKYSFKSSSSGLVGVMVLVCECVCSEGLLGPEEKVSNCKAVLPNGSEVVRLHHISVFESLVYSSLHVPRFSFKLLFI